MADALSESNVKNIRIVGGQDAVNKAIEESLVKAKFDVKRWSGATRYGTSQAVNEELGMKGATGVWVATGQNFPDALSAAVPAGKPDQRLVLSKKTCIPGPVVPEWIQGKDSKVRAVTLVGGEAVLTAGVKNLAPCKP